MESKGNGAMREVTMNLKILRSFFLWCTAFGHPGAGGSLGFADPESDIGYAYVTNRMGVSLTRDPRDLALRNALYTATPAAAGSKLGQLPHYIA